MTKQHFKIDDEQIGSSNKKGNKGNAKTGSFNPTQAGSAARAAEPSEKVGEDSLPAMVDEKAVELDDRIR